MKRFSRNVLLALLPIALLSVLVWTLRLRKADADGDGATLLVTPTATQAVATFQPFVRRVQVLPARPVDVADGFDTRVVVELDARGPLPPWWTGNDQRQRSDNGGQLVRAKAGQTTALAQTGYRTPPSLDFKTKQWVTTYNLKLRDIPSQGDQIRLRDTVQFADQNNQPLAQFPLDIPVRESGQTTSLPVVSHADCVKIERFSLDPTPPTESHDGIDCWRTTWVLLENIPLADAEKHGAGAVPRLLLLNDRNQQVGSLQSSVYSSQDTTATNRIPGAKEDRRRHFIIEDFALDGSRANPTSPDYNLKEPLLLQGDIRSGDKWPLPVKIPLRDATGKMLFTPRTASAPFRVVSVTKAAPTADETRIYGTDCVVSVMLRARDSKADVSQWHWEADYSQHLHTAKDIDMWNFSLKTERQIITPTYVWGPSKDRLELRYQLAVGSVTSHAGKLVFRADIAANRSRRIPVEVIVRP